MTTLSYAICIVHFGSSALTVRCVESILAMSGPSPLRRCIVDNSAKAEPLELPPTISREVVVVTPNENLGFAGGANLGLEFLGSDVRPDAILLLNNDAQVRPDGPAKLLGTLAKHPAVAMVGPRILDADDGRIWHDGGRVHWPEGTIESLRYGESEPDQALAPFDTEFVCGCAPLIRRTAFESVGGFDERFFLYYEDTDLSLRLLHRGWRLLHDPEARVDHVGSASVGAGSETARYYQLRNRILFHALHAPHTPDAERFRGRVLASARTRALRCMLSGRLGTARALWSAARDARRGRWGAR